MPTCMTCRGWLTLGRKCFSCGRRGTVYVPPPKPNGVETPSEKKGSSDKKTDSDKK